MKYYIERKKEETSLSTIKKRKFDRICHNLQMKRLQQHDIEGMMEGRSEGKTKKKT
jgi:hypothetical protein